MGLESNHLDHWEGVHFPLSSLDFWHVQCLQDSEKQTPTTDLNPRMLPTGPQLFSDDYSRIHVWGNSKRTGPPIVTLHLIWSVQLFRANYKYSPYAHLHSGIFVVVLWGLFYIGRTAASSQQRWDWILPHSEHIQLVWLLLYLRYDKKKRELCYPIHMYCVPWSGASPQARDPQHFRDQEQRVDVVEQVTTRSDWQNYWGGKAPLGITKSNPLPKAGSLKGLRAISMSRWLLMISKKCSITYYISYLCNTNVIMLIMKRGLVFCWFFFFLLFFPSCLHSFCSMLMFFRDLFWSSHWLEIN